MNTKQDIPQDIPADILASGVVCLTGGRDMADTPLLTFPTHTQPQLQTWSGDDLCQVLGQYVHWLSVISQAREVAFVADLQQAGKHVITTIVTALHSLQITGRGSVRAVYFLKPQQKARSRLLKKLLGLKVSKKHPKVPLFKILLLKTYQEVFSQIDLRNLTSDFGGTLDYGHVTWVKFYQTVAPCIREAEKVKKRVPDLRDRVELLQEYEVNNHSVASLQQLLSDLSQSYQHMISEVGIQETVDHCKQTLLMLDNTQAGEQWLTRVHQGQVQQAADCVRQLYTELAGQKTRLEDTWRDIEHDVTVHLQIQKHRDRAIEIEKRVMSHYQPLLQDHPSVGSTLSQAELYRTHFTTTLYEPAKELLSQAMEILQDMQRLREQARPPCEVTDVLQHLTVALQPFAYTLQVLQDTYVAVHVFHLLFQKAMTWYRKVLKFLPEGLQERAEAERFSTKIVHMPVEWHVTVQTLLNKHPPPREQHLARLDTDIPPQLPKRIRVQARALALRLRLLQRLLYSRRLPVKLVTTVFKWKAEAISSGGGPQPRDKNKERSWRKSSLLKGSDIEDSGLASPAKPARLMERSRSWSSFSSSSDAGLHVFPHTGYKLADSFTGYKLPDSFTGYQISNDSNSDQETDYKDRSQRQGSARAVMTRDTAGKVSHGQDWDSGNSNGSEAIKTTASWSASSAGHMQSKERFIRLTFSPSATPSSSSRPHDDNMDDAELDFEFGDGRLDSESGIEVLEDTECGWDSVVDRVKAVSTSNLPSHVKVQRMSYLLSRSKFSETPVRLGAELTFQNEDAQRLDAEILHSKNRLDDVKQQVDVSRQHSFVVAPDDCVRQYPTLDSMLGLAISSKSLQQGQTDDRETGLSVQQGQTDDRETGLSVQQGQTDDRETGLSVQQGQTEDRMTAVPVQKGQTQCRPISLPMHQRRSPPKPAQRVAKLRRRLARSLDDLDEINQQDQSDDDELGIIGSMNWRTCDRFHPTYHNVYNLHQPTGTHKQAMYKQGAGPGWVCAHPPWEEYAERVLARGQAGEQDRLRSPKHERRSGSGKTGSEEHDSDSLCLSTSQADFSRPSRTCSNSLETSPHWFSPPSPPRIPLTANDVSPGRRPDRWRQGIMEEYLSSRGAERRQSKEFIAPSFLKPFRSMLNLHLNSSHSASTRLYPARRHPDGSSGPTADSERRCMWDDGGLKESKGSLLLDSLSDQVEHEYLSQDEVESSLKRSHGILLEAEAKLKRQMQETGSACNRHAWKTDDTEYRHAWKTDDTESAITDFTEESIRLPDLQIYAPLRNQPEGHETVQIQVFSNDADKA